MLLAHARTLAIAEVIRGGVTFPKTGPFTNEQLAAEDWEPVYPAPPEPSGDCGCGEDKEEK